MDPEKFKRDQERLKHIKIGFIVASFFFGMIAAGYIAQTNTTEFTYRGIRGEEKTGVIKTFPFAFEINMEAAGSSCATPQLIKREKVLNFEDGPVRGACTSQIEVREARGKMFRLPWDRYIEIMDDGGNTVFKGDI